VSTSGLTRGKTDTSPPPGFQLFPADPTVLRLFSQLPRKLHDPKTFGHSYIRNTFPNFRTNARSQIIYSKLNRVSEANALPRSSANIRSRGQVRSRKLAKQRKYQENMASSTISNSEGMTKMFLQREDVALDTAGKRGQTPHSWSAKNGHIRVMGMLRDRSVIGQCRN